MLKKILPALFVAALFLTPAAQAQSYHHHHDWDSWWAAHHDVAVEVQTHPGYLHDREWLEHHREVRDYIRSHQAYVNEWTSNPYPFIEPTEHPHNGHWHQYDDHHWGY